MLPYTVRVGHASAHASMIERELNMSTENKQPPSELVNELNKLGENLANLVRAAWQSEERRSVEREIAASIEQMNKKLTDATEQIKNDAALNQAKRNMKDAWETAHGPQVVNEVKQGVLDTLKRINEELMRRGTPAQEASAPRAEAAADAVVEADAKPE